MAVNHLIEVRILAWVPMIPWQSGYADACKAFVREFDSRRNLQQVVG